MSLRSRLVGFLEAEDLGIPGGLTNTTSLIKSGTLDSLALVNLIAWIELELGGEVDLCALDLAEEWDTIVGIVQFIEKHAGGPA